MANLSIAAIRAGVRKDLLLFFSDRRSVIVSFIVPIAIASFFGGLFGNPGRRTERTRISVAVVDHDSSAISRGIAAGAGRDSMLAISVQPESLARDAVRRGKSAVAVVIPRGFGDAAARAFFRGDDQPVVDVLYDPSHSMEVAVVRGLLTQHVMQTVSAELFGGGAQGRTAVARSLSDVAGSSLPDDRKRELAELLGSVQRLNADTSASIAGIRRGISIPYTTRETPITANANATYNSYAHSFAGMAIQFLLFAMANVGVEMLLERQRGLWKRLRSAPVSKLTLLSSKALSGAIISLLILFVSFAFAMIVFHVRIQGSMVGFLGVGVACAAMASTFGLLVAALGNTPATARGVTTFAVLIMVMLGGAWVPSFVFPAWLQRATAVLPVRWAVDGLDAMTWRGLPLAAAVTPMLVLSAFAVAFGGLAVVRFRWEES
jgi:ABC-2 type transport system permease protein